MVILLLSWFQYIKALQTNIKQKVWSIVEKEKVRTCRLPFIIQQCTTHHNCYTTHLQLCSILHHKLCGLRIEITSFFLSFLPHNIKPAASSDGKYHPPHETLWYKMAIQKHYCTPTMFYKRTNQLLNSAKKHFSIPKANQKRITLSWIRSMNFCLAKESRGRSFGNLSLKF